MGHDDDTVLAQVHIRLDAVRAALHRRAHRLERVLRPQRLVPAVRDRLR